MKRILITAFLSIAAAIPAFAADLPQPMAPQAPAAYVPVVAPVYNWGGIYVGINGGWGWGNGKWTANTGTGTFSANANDNGGVVGGTLGANWQTGVLVFGVEGDWDYSGINTGTTSTICVVSGNCQTGDNWLSTIRGRFGYAMDRVLFYGTAGGAFANVQTTLNGASTTRTQSGWTAGVGAEWAFAENWTAKVEYLYVNLGNGNVSGACPAGLASCPVGTPFNVSVGLTENLVRAGVNFKFR
ncbi:MAG: outer membrane beta-barrel protein [Xanthobacteraceae bacterium]